MTHRQPAAEPSELPKGYVAEPEGTGWVVRATGGRWKALTGEQWRVSRDRLEVERWRAGVKRRRCYTGAILALDFPPRGHPDTRCLVLHTRGEQRVLATGEQVDLRRLGDWLSQQTGWRLRVAKHRPPRAGRRMFPLAAAFVLGGLVVTGIGVRQYRVNAQEVRQLRPVDAVDLSTTTPGTRVLATGTIGGLSPHALHGLVIYRASHYRAGYRGSQSLDTSDAHLPDFLLVQRHMTLPVTGGRYRMGRPTHRWQLGKSYYEGFRADDTVTVVGSAVSTPEGPAIDAELVFGGTASQLPGFVRREGLTTIAAGVLSVGIGVSLLALVRWQRRR